MDDICFVIMPFGHDFDVLYEKVYVPAIKASGLVPLRADEIYDNQPILQDINQSIHHAKVILADVTGRNPNVNYELGMAHALKKEVVILTSEPNDVPSDYRHLRYIQYNRMDIDWNRKLSKRIQNTLEQILIRLKKSDKSIVYSSGLGYEDIVQDGTSPIVKESKEDEWDSEVKNVITKATNLGMQFQQDSHSRSHALMSCMDCHVMLESREGPIDKLNAAMACLLNDKVHALSLDLPKGHCLRMRRVFFDLYATHAFFVDYLYDFDVLPMYTQNELFHLLKDEFCGQIFEPKIRYIEENFKHDRFNADKDQYYSLDSLPQEQIPVCFRQGFYIADISKTFYNETRGDYFYQIKGLLPSYLLKADIVPGENHWLADWGQKEQQCRIGDTVKFKVDKVYPLKDYSHISKARNINFSQLEVILKGSSN